MAKINLTLPYGEVAVTGKQVTFEAPCDSDKATALIIDGTEYTLVDSLGESLPPHAFYAKAMVSVILNNETLQAFIQNPNTTKHIEDQLQGSSAPTFVEAEVLENIISGESLSKIMGKIAKLFSEFLKGVGSILGITKTKTQGLVDTYTIAYTNGSTSTFTVTNGKDGKDGTDGTDGTDGVSPTISVSNITGGHRITITDKNGTKTVDVMDGSGYSGSDGRGIETITRTSGTGAAGTTDTYTITYTDKTKSTFTVYNGKDGTDGFSPTISVTAITGGHRITITDENSTKTVDVIDGVDGVDGRGIKSISRTSGNGSAGTTDTYTITYTDNTTSTFTVYNGKNGTDGKTAYEYAVQGGFSGTEAQFATKLATPFITPQMYGAKGDGTTDDTVAIQTTLDKGGLIYFPPGRYKVTSLLTASKSCRIEMFKQYPSSWATGDAGNYPLTSSDNWMGSRIETYSTNGGMVIGASTEVNGLYIRAMQGFSGVLLKYDDSVGLPNYPSTVRISHVRLDNENHLTIPEVMFDFVPRHSYYYFFEDINIGRRNRVFCKYGFRADLSKLGDDNWANNVYINGLCIDLFADYPLYVDGAMRAAPWQFNGLSIQTYPYDSTTSSYGNGRTGHSDIVTLKNLQETTFLSCYLWDLHKADYNNIFVTENITNTACVGCSPEFDQIETALSNQLLSHGKNFTVKHLTVDVVTDSKTGDNQLTFSDPKGDIQRVVIPGAALSDEQVNNGVEKWMNENSFPYEAAGRNKVDVNSEDFKIGYYLSPNGAVSANTNMAITNYIKAKYKDILRIAKAGSYVTGYSMACYDYDKNWLATYDIRANNPHGITPTAIEVLMDGTAYIRICATKTSFGEFETIESNQICITVNDPDVSYEPYSVSIAGGLGEYIILQSPNGTRYKLAVNDNGTIMGEVVSN